MSSQREPRQLAPVPETVARVAGTMSAYPRWWAVCGGWAVDAWLGRVTRDHHDVDIAVFHDEQREIFNHLAGCHLVAHDDNVPGATTEPWSGRWLDMPAHLHVRAEDGFEFEVNFVERSGGEWLFHREPRVTRPLEACVGEFAWALPSVSPEVAVYHKALMPQWRARPRFEAREQDIHDFQALLPNLTADQRSWLRASIELVDPAHPWLEPLSHRAPSPP